jgi:hypothetical protein
MLPAPALPLVKLAIVAALTSIRDEAALNTPPTAPRVPTGIDMPLSLTAGAPRPHGVLVGGR